MKKIISYYAGSQLELTSVSSGAIHSKTNNVFDRLFERNRVLWAY